MEGDREGKAGSTSSVREGGGVVGGRESGVREEGGTVRGPA